MIQHSLFTRFQKQIFLSIAIFSLGMFFSNVFAQVLVYNNGGSIFAASGSLIHIDGTTENANSGKINNQGGAILITNGNLWNDASDTVINQGLISIRGDFKNDKYTDMSPAGIFKLSGDWINNGTFISGGGTAKVFMDGTTQLIKGSSISVFRDLELQNQSIKTQNINSAVSGILTLNDCELATDIYSMTILSASNAAITRTSGFVSSLGNGTLEWAASAGTNYEFPTGSSLGTVRFRPVSVTPVLAGRIGARLANNDASIDGLSTSQMDNASCAINKLYYHRIHSNVNMNADIAIAYDPAADGSWVQMANWSNSMWTDMGGATAAMVTSMQAVKKTQWSYLNSLFPSDAYVLSTIRPVPLVTGSDVCANQSGTYQVSNPDAGSTYTWTVSPSGTPFTSLNADVNVNWGGSGTGIVGLTQTAANGCVSLPVAYNVNINANPIADFKPLVQPATAGETVEFQDLSIGATHYHWDFGNTETLGDTSNAINPNFVYDNSGQYVVTLDVSNAKGCKSSKVLNFLEVLNGIIPNVVTVNNDGLNDLFHIKGFTEYQISIYNRWGEKLFESNDRLKEWDGKTTSGDFVPGGVYYYILKPKTGKVLTGNVTIIR